MFLKLSKIVPQRIVSRLNALKTDIAKVGKISFEVYLGMIVFTFAIVGIAAFLVSFVFLSLILPLIYEPKACKRWLLVCCG